jgi:hypothetical protein
MPVNRAIPTPHTPPFFAFCVTKIVPVGYIPDKNRPSHEHRTGVKKSHRFPPPSPP